MQKLKNNRGVALIAAYVVLTSLIILSTGFVSSTSHELANARRNFDSTRSFWLAEAASNQFKADTTMLDSGKAGVTCNGTVCQKTITFGNDSVLLSKDDLALTRTVTATTSLTTSDTSRAVEIEYEALTPGIFDNTMSTGGDVDLDGIAGVMNVHGKTRLTGVYNDLGRGLFAWFEDKVEGTDIDETILTYPDADNNGTADEFSDFVTFYRDLVATYPAEEVVYLPGNGTFTITPNSDLVGKKIVFVDGDEGSGNVNIVFDATWADNQDITIISTGDINHIQPLASPVSNSRLNTIAWTKYYEPAALLSIHRGLTYTHGWAYLRDVWDVSITQGSLIANDRVYVKETVAWKEFFFDNSIVSDLPPGFEGLLMGSGGGGTSGYQTESSSWKEI